MQTLATASGSRVGRDRERRQIQWWQPMNPLTCGAQGLAAGRQDVDGGSRLKDAFGQKRDWQEIDGARVRART
jgi:hypothetical protein